MEQKSNLSIGWLVFIFGTDTGVAAISWLIGIGSAVIRARLIYLATRVKHLRARIEGIGDHM